MANAETLSAPLKKEGAKEYKWIEVELGDDKEKVKEDSNEYFALTQVFDSEKKYMFQLANESHDSLMPVMEISNNGRTVIPLPAKKFTPKRNIVFSSQIVWNGQRRNIRYYAGCTTIFVDKQPKDKDILSDAIKSTKQEHFIDGKWGANGYEKMLLLYMNICSWNVESNFRTKTATPIFYPLNADKIADETTLQIDLIEKALKLAKDASDVKMFIHSDYLGISRKDYDSDNERSPKEIRALYREAASKNPKLFIESYGNKGIEIKYYIDKALEDGKINTKFNPNKAVWKGSNTEICDISGLKSTDSIAQKIFEHSQSESGEDFVIQLKALYDK